MQKQKAMFFEEAYNKGLLTKVNQGYILSVISPDLTNPNTIHNPFLIEIISYSGVKSVHSIPGGVKFLAAGKKMYCMIEPSSYSFNYVEPSLRSNNTTEFMPFRFDDCEIFLTRDGKFKILIPKSSKESFDSFTVDFPEKGDISILYFIFDKDINGVVLPFIEENYTKILKEVLTLQSTDAKKVAKKFMEVVLEFDVFPDD